jgi:CubicO group peptidase (beta-lactamase class C family)
MHGLRKIPCLLLIIACVIAFGATRTFADDPGRVKPEAVGLSPEKLKRIDEAFEKVIENKQLSGAVVLIARKGKVGYLQTFGMADVEAKKPMKTDTIFRIASMTKPVTSVAVMMLVDEGKIALDDPVSKFIPEFKNQKVLVPGKSDKDDDFSLVPVEREVTIKDLLTHTSGLVYPFLGAPKQLVALYTKANINYGIGPSDGKKLADNIKRLGELPLAHQPGEKFTYSLSTDTLGRVVEVASGKELDEFLRERIFKPLGMRDTSFLPEKDKMDRVAVLYKWDKDKKITPTVKGDFTVEGSATYFSGGAGLFSTAGDYARFLQMLLNGGELNGVRLLKTETVKQMTQNQIGKKAMFTPAHGDGFGYGFGVVTTPVAHDKTHTSIGSFSWAGAFYTFFWVDPSKELLGAMMTQLIGQGTELKLWEEFPKLTMDALQ